MRAPHWEQKADAGCILGSGADISTSDSRHKKVGKKAKKELTNGGADGNIAERSREGSTSDASPERKTSKNLEKSS